MDNEIVSGQEALALVWKLQAAKAYPVRDWYHFEHQVPNTPGAYRFTDPDGLRVYVGEAEKDLRNRLSKQVMPHRLGKPWSLERPPPLSVCTGRNLLNNVLKDLRPRIPPNRPQNAENRGESGFPGSVGLRVGDRHPVGQGSLTGGTSRLSPVTTKSPAGGSGKDQVGRVAGHDGAALSRGHGVRGAAHAAARGSDSGAERRGV